MIETGQTMHVFDLDQIDGEIGNALRFIKNLSSEEKLASEKDVDPKSPMEKKVIGWFRKTSFYLENKKTNIHNHEFVYLN